MTYDQWKNDYPINDGPDDNSDWESLVEAFEYLDCPCGGWDCTGAPEGSMYGCPYQRS